MLRALERGGVFAAVGKSQWRKERLLILCYHGVSLYDEHLWNPDLYVTPEFLHRRLQILEEAECVLLSLDEALERLRNRTLPPRSVAVTFDDGTYDFHARAWPVLRRRACPTTVYLTTYYSGRQVPVFDVGASYLLWRARGSVIEGGKVGLRRDLDLRTQAGRASSWSALIRFVAGRSMVSWEKEELLRRLAAGIGVDYGSLAAKRLLHIMAPEEVASVSSEGAAIELHTHRHRVPEHEGAFRREIEENRFRIRQMTGREPSHFCYPSGIFHERCACWLTNLGIRSAATCIPGYARMNSEPLQLRRFVDSGATPEVVFRAWATGGIRLIGAGSWYRATQQIRHRSPGGDSDT